MRLALSVFWRIRVLIINYGALVPIPCLCFGGCDCLEFLAPRKSPFRRFNAARSTRRDEQE